ncbi:MAG TPA: LamG-like jellyroll fold domain-containing protein [Solirubrobacteraceae bacterium]|nr:LamG-like jellyroll fold domain-containing protein [Solirubrobacteraceae bacterium]
MTVSTPRRRPGRVLLRLLTIVVAATATLVLSSLAAPPLAAAAAPTLTGHWTFDEGSGTTAADSSGANDPLTLANGASWGPGVVGPHSLAVSTPSQQYAQTARPVIDTTQSFTVSAWVYLTSTSGYQTFVSQDGTQISGFFLQLRADTGRFAFTRPAYDSPKALGIIASAPNIIPQPNEWYHLAGVYNQASQTISLYVNGVLQQTQSYVPNWGATGPLAVGRGFFNSADTDYVSGNIDDVRTYAGTLGANAISQLAGPGQLSVDASQHGPAINSTQFGEFLEEINHSADGGLYAELIRNRDLKESASSPVAWSEVGSPGTDAGVSLDSSQPLNSANPVSLKLAVGAGTTHGRVGVANAGYWGIPVKPSTTYKVSFFARSDAANPGPLTVDLESNSGHVWASSTVTGVTGSWQQFTTTVHTNGGAPASLENRVVISTPAASASGSNLWFTIVSLFPPTYDNTANGLRIDLMQELAGLHPGYMRIPGGNYLEGDTIDTRFDWEDTVGPIQDRPGHDNSAWGYWSQDGMGLLEYLELAEELHASPVLAVWAGYTLTGTVVPQSQLQPYVQSALDEIQYAIGPTTTYWGAQRAADGHPAPFDLSMVEIGNEDFFDGSGSYNAYRYPMFANAIRAAYPQLKLIATTPVTNGPVDIVDEHYYNNDPQYFAENAHLFDGMSRSGPKVIVGEYATTNGTPTGTLANAVGEAAFLTGTERNSDLVLGASYAPLLVNVNAPSWPTNLIGYDALKSYVSPSYWAQEMLSTQHGDHVIGSQLVSGSGTLFEVASQGAGHTYLAVVNDGSAPAQTTISLAGLGAGASGGTATVLTGNPDAMNSLAQPNAVAPVTRRLGSVGTSFADRFPANSVTVLNLTTGAASSTSAMRRAVRQAKFKFTFSPAAPKLRPTKRERRWRQSRS